MCPEPRVPALDGWDQLTLLSPVIVPTKQTGQRSRALTRLRNSRSEGLSRSAFDSWYSAPQISSAFKVGSPSCRQAGKKKGQWALPHLTVLLGTGEGGWPGFREETYGPGSGWYK